MVLSSPENKIKQKSSSFIILLTMVLSPIAVHGQMFSVDSKSVNAHSTVPAVGVYVGWEPINFEYQGDTNVSEAGYLAFNGSVLRFRFETSILSLYLGTGGGITGLDDVSYFDVGIRTGYDFQLYRQQGFSVSLPVLLHSSYAAVTNNRLVAQTTPDFQQGTFELGTGLRFKLRAAPSVRFALNVLPSYGFLFSTTERDAGGSIAALEGQFRAYLDHLFGRAGLSIGYDFGLRNYDNEQQRLQYKATTHSILIGVTF